eukprot:6206154-Pleurochrysis_carterae.AAC.1
MRGTHCQVAGGKLRKHTRQQGTAGKGVALLLSAKQLGKSHPTSPDVNGLKLGSVLSMELQEAFDRPSCAQQSGQPKRRPIGRFLAPAQRHHARHDVGALSLPATLPTCAPARARAP